VERQQEKYLTAAHKAVFGALEERPDEVLERLSIKELPTLPIKEQQ
jgi:hypothetical protein